MSTKFLSLAAALFVSRMPSAKGAIAELEASDRAPADASSTTIESTYDTTVTSADLLLNRPFTTSVSGPTDNGFPISGINDGQYSTFNGSNAGTTVGASSHDAFFGANSGVQM